MINNTNKFYILKKTIFVIIILFLIMFVLINFATMKREEVPLNSDDSKSNGTFISDYKLLDSIIKIDNKKYMINGIWSAYSIASFNNIFLRLFVEINSPQFIISMDNGFDFITEHRFYKFYFPEFSDEPSFMGGTGIENNFYFNYELLESDTTKLRTLDTVQFYILNKQDIIVSRLTIVKK